MICAIEDVSLSIITPWHTELINNKIQACRNIPVSWILFLFYNNILLSAFQFLYIKASTKVFHELPTDE
jgi:hypothetical protein